MNVSSISAVQLTPKDICIWVHNKVFKEEHKAHGVQNIFERFLQHARKESVQKRCQITLSDKRACENVFEYNYFGNIVSSEEFHVV